jgi:hypothetical protein
MALKRSKLTGLNTLAYVGVEPSSPPQFVYYTRQPTSQDWDSFHIGDLWLDEVGRTVWLLQLLTDGLADWIKIGDSLSWLSYFKTDSGNAYPAAGVINVLGDGVLTTTGVGNEVSVILKPGTIGQFYLGGNPIPFIGDLTCDDASISITPVGHDIHIDSTDNSLKRLLADDGFHADPLNRFFTVLGDINIATFGGFLNPETLTIRLQDDIEILGTLAVTQIGAGVVRSDGTGAFYADKGLDGQTLIGKTGDKSLWANITSTAGSIIVTDGPNSINIEVAGSTTLLSLAGNIGFAYNSIDGSAYMSGSTNITTVGGTGAGDELTIDLNNSIDLLGTITLPSLGIGVLFSSPTGVFSSSNGTNGQLLIGRTVGGQPAWNSVTSTGGTILITPGAGTLSLKKIGGNGTLTQLRGGVGIVTNGTPASYHFDLGRALLTIPTNMVLSSGTDTVVVSLDDNASYRLNYIGVVTMNNGYVISDATGLLSSTGLGTNGQLIIGGASPLAFSSVTSSDNSIDITVGPNSLSLDIKNITATSYAFAYAQETSGSGVALGGAGSYSLGQSVVLTKIFDDGNNVYVGSGAGAAASFTAPVSGKYFLNMNVQFYSANNSLAYIADLTLRIVTTKRTYYHGITQNVTVPMLECTRKFSACVDMDITDTATFSMVADLGPGTGTITVNGGLIASPVTWISGYLIMVN